MCVSVAKIPLSYRFKEHSTQSSLGVADHGRATGHVVSTLDKKGNEGIFIKQKDTTTNMFQEYQLSGLPNKVRAISHYTTA